jgi:hypothetical protein
MLTVGMEIVNFGPLGNHVLINELGCKNWNHVPEGERARQ